MTAPQNKSVFVTWLIIFLLVLYFFLYSLFAYLVVGNQGQPAWNFGTVKDVPAESPYALTEGVPPPQHIGGEKEKR